MEEYIGVIKLFAGIYIPEYYKACNGQLLEINEYPALYSIMGTTYGGDGRVTFALPDLRGRVPVGSGKGPGLSENYLGEYGGQETVPLAVSQLPPHTHTVKAGNFEFTPDSNSVSVKLYASKDEGNVNEPAQGAYLSTAKAGAFNANIYQSTTPSEKVELGGIEMTGSYGISGKVSGDIISEETGGGRAHENMQPYQVLNYIICVEGNYPPRP